MQKSANKSNPIYSQQRYLVKVGNFGQRHHQVLSIEIKGCKITRTVMSAVNQLGLQ